MSNNYKLNFIINLSNHIIANFGDMTYEQLITIINTNNDYPSINEDGEYINPLDYETEIRTYLNTEM